MLVLPTVEAESSCRTMQYCESNPRSILMARNWRLTANEQRSENCADVAVLCDLKASSMIESVTTNHRREEI